MFHDAEDNLEKPWLEDRGTDEFGDCAAEMIPCPSCGSAGCEDAEHCPVCGDNTVRSTHAWHGRPWWWVLLGLAGVTAVLWLMMP